MKDTTKVQSEQASLEVIHQVTGKTPPPKVEPTDAAAELTLDGVALPELTNEFNAKKKTRRSIPFQFLFFGTFVLGFLSLVRGCSTMSQPQAKEQEQTVASAPLEESERQELLQVINEQNLAIQQLQQGKRIDLRTGKDKKLPKPAVSSRTINRVNQPTRKTPPPAATTARTIPVRRSVPPTRPRFVPSKPRIVYRDRVVYKPAPTPMRPQTVAAASPKLQPVNRVSLSKKFEPPQAKPKSRPIQIKRLPHKPVRVSTTPIRPETPIQPKLTGAESGVLVASNAMTGDLMQDMSAASGPDAITRPQTEGVTPTQTSFVRGSIPAGTKVKAAFANPLTWVAGQQAPAGQRVLLRLKGDLGSVAKKGSTAIGEVMSVQGDFAQVQIVEINGRPIDHVNLNDPEGNTRTQPVAMVQYKDTPYLQAKAKNTGGSDFGGRLLRAGLNVGIDQLRDQGIGSRAGNVVNSLLPDRNRFSQRGGNLYFFEGKDVEIYFLEGM
ncbi:hypothetical protein [Acaryochloris sp. CCMEE 5410]|uniref:hypothetical protein n=1 Tax=Acaryochloris sp. CCMEE 5410 TaxID=310037 RepID=UPI0002483A00|nr:hypothetical protein [Acaryochloris sp. CCMEE 5410]KAI9129453.1 hypothetical protein ON05_035700 [Acaryochloris sp. CCMEE 5410]